VQVDPRGVPGVKELAVPFNSLDDALHARDALAAIEAKLSAAEPSYPPLSSTVMVVGAGYAGESTIPAIYLTTTGCRYTHALIGLLG
jgi:NADH dehydrogenase FAD-containing subunit